MDFDKPSRDWISVRRKSLDLTQAELGELVGCSAEYIRKIEQGLRRPSKQIASLLADALRLPDLQRESFVASIRNLPAIPETQNVAPKNSRITLSLQPARAPVKLIGRAQELNQIAELLNNPDCQLLTIFGPGGIGKTELVLAAANEHAAQFRDGLVTVMLSPIQSPDMFPASLTNALNIPLYGENDPIAEAINFLREKQLLLVLDNFEHLLESAGVVTRILATAHEVKILVTSRERLKLTDEWVIDLQGLSYPADGEGVSEAFGAVDLFCRFARRFVPRFALSENAGEVGSICRQVRGMPLAIEMAASWLRHLSCQGIADQMIQNKLALSSTSRDVPSRHRSMKAVFDQSWRLLTEEEQLTLMQVSVFAGSFEIDAACEVAGASYEWLLALVDQALLYHIDNSRFGMHPLVRQYAAERLAEAGLEISIKNQHLSYFQKRSADFGFRTMNEETIPRLNQFDNYNDDFRAAMNWSRLDGSRIQEGLKIAVNLYFVWQLGRIPEAKLWIMNLSTVVQDLPDNPMYADWLWVAGGVAWFQGDNEVAYDYIRRAVESHPVIDGTQDYTFAQILGAQGWVQKTLSKFREAEQIFRISADFAQTLGSEGLWLYCVSRSNEGELALIRGDMARAIVCLNELQQTSVNKANLWSMAWIHMLRGQIALAQNNYPEAKAQFEEVISWRHRWPAINYTALFLNYAAEAALQQQQFDDAIKGFEDARSLAREFGNLNGMAYAYYNIALAARRKGDLPKARAVLLENLRYNDSIDHVPGIVISLGGLAEFTLYQGQFELAAKLAGFVKRHYKTTYNTIFSFRRVEPEALISSFQRHGVNFPEFEALLTSGSEMTPREAIELVGSHFDEDFI